MAVNTAKALEERLAAKVTEMRELQTTLSSATGDALVEARKAFDAGISECEGLKGDLARAKAFEAHAAEFEGGDRRGKSDEELAAMTPEEKRSDKVDPLLNPDAKDYRLGRVILARMNGQALTGVEAEVAQELQKRKMSGSETRGSLIPLTLRFNHTERARAESFARMSGLNESEVRALNSATTGTAALPTILSGTLIDLLRNTAVCMRAGCTLLSGLEGTFDMPKVSGAPTFAWGGEGFTPSESSGAIASKVTFTQKTVGARSKITRRFALQSLKSLDVENWQRQQLLIYLALGIDWGALHGPGTSNNVEGVFENSSVPVISNGTNGAALTFGKIVDMETSVADNNAEIGEAKYLTNARVRGQAKQTLRASASGSAMIWENDMMNGHEALMSNQIANDYDKGTGEDLSGVAYGVWSQMVIGTWSGADLVVDPYTSGDEGATNIYLHQDVDVQLLHDEAFAIMKDVDAQI